MSYDWILGEAEVIGDSIISINDSRQFVSPEGITISALELLINEEELNNFILLPKMEYYPKMNVVYARPAINTSLKRDIQVILNNWQNEIDSQFEIHISNNPLMIWIWIGGIVMSIGGILILLQPRNFSPKNKR